MPRVDPDLVHAAFKAEADQYEQSQRFLAMATGLGAFGLWVVAALLTTLICSIFLPDSLDDIGATLILAGLAFDSWRRLQARRQERIERIAFYAQPVPRDEDAEQGQVTILQHIDRWLFMPGRVTAQAIDTWQLRREWSESDMDHVVALLMPLLQAPAWINFSAVQAEQLDDEQRATLLVELVDMKQVWERQDDKRHELRVNPLFRKNCGVTVSDEVASEEELATVGPMGGTIDLDKSIGASVDPLAANRKSDKPAVNKNDDIIDVDL